MRFRRKGVAYKEGSEIPASNLTMMRVEAYATQVAEAFDFPIGGNPADIAEALGGEITYGDLDDWIDESGSIFVHSEGEFDILLPSYTSPLRDNFTIGHELGHYFLHSDQGAQPIVAYRKGSTRIEWEANWFAAALLMPREAFKKASSKTNDLALLAAKFGVSTDAAKIRRAAVE